MTLKAARLPRPTRFDQAAPKKSDYELNEILLEEDNAGAILLEDGSGPILQEGGS